MMCLSKDDSQFSCLLNAGSGRLAGSCPVLPINEKRDKKAACCHIPFNLHPLVIMIMPSEGLLSCVYLSGWSMFSFLSDRPIDDNKQGKTKVMEGLVVVMDCSLLTYIRTLKILTSHLIKFLHLTCNLTIALDPKGSLLCGGLWTFWAFELGGIFRGVGGAYFPSLDPKNSAALDFLGL